MECYITTIDNPFDPILDFDNWYAYDESKGYHTSGYLARIVKTSDDLSPTSQARDIEAAIDEIIEMNPSGLYKKVKKI